MLFCDVDGGGGGVGMGGQGGEGNSGLSVFMLCLESWLVGR